MDYLTEDSNEVQSYFATHHIPTYFYQCLFGELVKIWGINFVHPDPTADSYKDQLDEYLALTTGTAGWNLAFKQACAECDLTDVYDYYVDLEWDKSDIFDGHIADELTAVLFGLRGNTDYYRFKMRKENR